MKRLIFSSLTTFWLLLCPYSAPAAEDPRLLGAVTSFRVGTVYVLEPEVATAVLDLGANRASGDASGWMSERDVSNSAPIMLHEEFTGDPVGRCAPTSKWRRFLSQSYCARKATRVVVELNLAQVRHIELANPYALLEVLNRPPTGLEYNRTAEARLAQWRAAIATSVATLGAGSRLSLCTSVDELRSAEVIVRGRIDSERAAAALRQAQMRTALELSPIGAPELSDDGASVYRYRLVAPVVYGTTLRDLVFAGLGAYPTVNFALGAPRVLSAAGAKANCCDR